MEEREEEEDAWLVWPYPRMLCSRSCEGIDDVRGWKEGRREGLRMASLRIGELMMGEPRMDEPRVGGPRGTRRSEWSRGGSERWAFWSGIELDDGADPRDPNR